ncbi:MAG: cyanophycin synthetase, partial [Victivallales bacterium]|nr:cyanophycin synthetase [Victivallales bacterium]
IVAGLAACRLPGMRMRITSRAGDITWINDAYNANPDSMSSSLYWLKEFVVPERLILVLGDMLELGGYAAAGHRGVLEQAAAMFPRAQIYAVGAEMTAATRSLPSALQKKIICCPDAATATKCLSGTIAAGSTVFLKGSRGMKLEQVEPGGVK